MPIYIYISYNYIHGDDDDDEEVDTTRTFEPGTASTPYYNGEHVEMHTLPREQSGLSFDENIPLINPEEFIHDTDKQERIKIAKAFIKRRHPEADFSKIDPIGFGKKRKEMKTQ